MAVGQTMLKLGSNTTVLLTNNYILLAHKQEEKTQESHDRTSQGEKNYNPHITDKV